MAHYMQNPANVQTRKVSNGVFQVSREDGFGLTAAHNGSEWIMGDLGFKTLAACKSAILDLAPAPVVAAPVATKAKRVFTTEQKAMRAAACRRYRANQKAK